MSSKDWTKALAAVGLNDDNFITTRKEIGEMKVIFEWILLHPIIPTPYHIWLFLDGQGGQWWSYVNNGVYKNPPSEVIDLIRWAVVHQDPYNGYVPAKILYDGDRWKANN